MPNVTIEIPGPKGTKKIVEVPDNDPILSRPFVKIVNPGNPADKFEVPEELKQMVENAMNEKDSEIQQLSSQNKDLEKHNKDLEKDLAKAVELNANKEAEIEKLLKRLDEQNAELEAKNKMVEELQKKSKKGAGAQENPAT